MEKLTLTQFQQQLILSVCPKGSRIICATYFRDEYLPCPIRVVVDTLFQEKRTLVLRLVRHPDANLEKEARLFKTLAGLNLPVPNVLVEPQEGDDRRVAVYSFCPGQNLQQLSEESTEGLKLAVQLVIEAITRLAEITKSVKNQIEPSLLPNITLSSQLERIVNSGGEWLEETVFQCAVERLQPIVESITDPLVFTNGDYQPANFLTDGKKVTGFLDFEYAAFQDFLFGFVKYPIYDLYPLSRTNLITDLQKEKGVSPHEFAIRQALGCLFTLQREIPKTGGNERYRSHVLNLLQESFTQI